MKKMEIKLSIGDGEKTIKGFNINVDDYKKTKELHNISLVDEVISEILSSIEREELHLELTEKIANFVDSIEGYNSTPLIICKNVNEKGFGVLMDNGKGGKIKRFKIIIEG